VGTVGEVRGEFGVPAPGDGLEQLGEGDEFTGPTGGGAQDVGELGADAGGDGGDTQAVGVQQAGVVADGYPPPALPVEQDERVGGEVAPAQVGVSGLAVDPFGRRDPQEAGAPRIRLSVASSSGQFINDAPEVIGCRRIRQRTHRIVPGRALLAAENAFTRHDEQQPAFSLISGPAAGTVASHTARTLTDLGDRTGTERQHRAALLRWEHHSAAG